MAERSEDSVIILPTHRSESQGKCFYTYLHRRQSSQDRLRHRINWPITGPLVGCTLTKKWRCEKMEIFLPEPMLISFHRLNNDPYYWQNICAFIFFIRLNICRGSEQRSSQRNYSTSSMQHQNLGNKDVEGNSNAGFATKLVKGFL